MNYEECLLFEAGCYQPHCDDIKCSTNGPNCKGPYGCCQTCSPGYYKTTDSRCKGKFCSKTYILTQIFHQLYYILYLEFYCIVL